MVRIISTVVILSILMGVLAATGIASIATYLVLRFWTTK